MFEELTAFIPELQQSEYGEWIIDNENDGSFEHPMQLPYVSYDKTIKDFIIAVYRFVDSPEGLYLRHYQEVLAKSGIKWNSAESVKNADVSSLDGKTVMALILSVLRADRFCEGALLEFLQKGIIEKWLVRLKELDHA